MDLRRELIERIAAGEKPADLRREYGVSKKTVNKFRKRFAALGLAGLADRSRAPHVIPHKTTPELEQLVVAERKAHETWGPKKLKVVLEKRLGATLPSASTIGNILERNGLVTKRKKRRNQHIIKPTALRIAEAPNDVWCIDYKGQFRLGDKSYCYPLTITDQVSRYILACEGMPAISDEEAREVCAEVFAKFGLPKVIRSDNGPPFASTGLAGLTRLSVSWLRLGIGLERIRPAHPEENGRHERMHLTLKRETTRPARRNLLQQQESFDAFVHEFNHERPHEALAMKSPADVYVPSKRMPKLSELSYPGHDDTIRIDHRGYLKGLSRREVFICRPLADEYVGVREETDGAWLITFANIDLGHIRGTTFVPRDFKATQPKEADPEPMSPV